MAAHLVQASLNNSEIHKHGFAVTWPPFFLPPELLGPSAGTEPVLTMAGQDDHPEAMEEHRKASKNLPLIQKKAKVCCVACSPVSNCWLGVFLLSNSDVCGAAGKGAVEGCAGGRGRRASEAESLAVSLCGVAYRLLPTGCWKRARAVRACLAFVPAEFDRHPCRMQRACQRKHTARRAD
jgi:hypothetical protein